MAPTSLMRFVQVRRLTPADDQPAPTCKAPPSVFDFGDNLLEATREVILTGNRQLGLAHQREVRDSLDDGTEAVGRLALSLTRASVANEYLTVGALDARVAKWARDNGVAGTVPGSRRVHALTYWATALITLRRWLRPDADVSRIEPVNVLRGVALLRLTEAELSDACLVRRSIAGQQIRLPEVPGVTTDAQPVPPGSVGGVGTAAGAAPGTAIALLEAPARPATAESNGHAQRISVGSGQLLEGTVSDTLAEPPPVGSWPYVDPAVPALSAQARVLGRGDLMIVRSSHLRYDLGTISHIENVLASEQRGRKYEIETSTSERETEGSTALSETSTELESTEHNSLERATSSASTSSSGFAVGVSVSGGLGPVKAGVDIDASSSSSTSESNSSAVSFAKDVTEKASELLRAEEEYRRTTTTRTRVMETNEHAFDNSDGVANIAGIYRWVDKVDQAQVFNYGERLLLEFVVPEPAAQYVGQAEADAEALTPLPPAAFDLHAGDLTEGNYITKAAAYNAQGLEPPPAAELFVAATFIDPAAKPYTYPEDSEATQPDWGYTSYAKEVTVPAGYEATTAYVAVTWGASAPGVPPLLGQELQDVDIAVGDDKVSITDRDTDEVHSLELSEVGEGPVPVVLSIDQAQGAAVGVRIRCTLTDAAFAAWQLRTYETIQRAYLDQQEAYETAVRVQQAREAYVSTTPESVNRMIEMQELKRGCQTTLTGQDFDLYGAVTFPVDDLPRIDRAEASEEAEQIQFFEDCFEWENLTYLFYPYQWAGRPRWPDLLSRSSADPLHEAFLRAGAARVVVPVREGYEHAVGSYLATSEVPESQPRPWRDGGSPYPPIEDLIADANDRPGDEVPIGEPWEVVTPTSLIYLQENGDLNPTAPSS